MAEHKLNLMNNFAAGLIESSENIRCCYFDNVLCRLTNSKKNLSAAKKYVESVTF